MTIQVNIDDDSLNDLVSKGIKNLPEEAIGKLAKEAVEKVFSDEHTIKEMVFKKRERNWCGVDEFSDIRPEIINMLSRAFTDKEVKEFRTQLLEMLKKNKRELMTAVLADIFIKRVFDDPYAFMMEMRNKMSHRDDE